jgi:hypothetical protein
MLTYLACGAGCILLCFFQADPPGGPFTWHGHIHSGIVGCIGAIFIGSGRWMIPSMKRNPAWRAYATFTLVAKISCAIFGIGWFAFSHNILFPWRGLYERLVFLPVFIWLEAISLHLYRLSTKHPT